MKKITITVVFLIYSIFIVNAQIEKGKIFVGANSNMMAHFGSSKWKNDSESQKTPDKITNLNFNLEGGYFIIDGLAAGANLNLTSDKTKETNENESWEKYTISTFLFSPFIRYYFGTTNFKPYTHIKIGLGSKNSKYEESDDPTSYEDSYSISDFRVGAGVAYFINENISLNTQLEYNIENEKQKNDNSENYKTTNSGLNINFGLAVYF